MGLPEIGASALGLGANLFGAKKGVEAMQAAKRPGGKKNPEAPPDFEGLAREQGEQQRRLLEEQTRANRPNQNTPFASSQWVRGPDGQWTQQVSLNGGLGQASNALQNQLAEQMRQPLDMSTLPQVGTGESARAQAIEAAMGQAESRLNPRFNTMRERERTRLLNQGLEEGSEAFKRAMGELGMQENDAFNQALFSAQREGTAAGSALFNQNMAARNQALQEALQRRRQPMQELGFLQSLTSMPGFAQAGLAPAPNLLGAGGMQDAADFRNWNARNQAEADFWGGVMDLVSTIGSAALSDERAKERVERLPFEAAPGVPMATFRYKPGMGPAGLYAGVVAQDLQEHHPEAVVEGEDGLLYVTGEFAPTKIGE